jgi:hypothetical protein
MIKLVHDFVRHSQMDHEIINISKKSLTFLFMSVLLKIWYELNWVVKVKDQIDGKLLKYI